MTETAAKLDAIWGPIKVKTRGHKLVFTFVGVTPEGEARKLSLNFTATTRTWGASSGQPPLSREWNGAARALTDLAGLPAGAVRGPFAGRLTDALRGLLQPEHVAAATALALCHGAAP